MCQSHKAYDIDTVPNQNRECKTETARAHVNERNELKSNWVASKATHMTVCVPWLKTKHQQPLKQQQQQNQQQPQQQQIQ